jgi:UDP-N-acetylglucosamine 2-epimerase (non-hydrolysing)
MLTVLSIFGTRPEALKMAPVVQQLERRSTHLRSIVCVTAQHRQMLDQVNTLFGIQPDFDLDVMLPNQTLSQVTSSVIQRLEPIVKQTRPDWILIQGDTTTVMAASLVGFYHGVKIGHVEAGLRTYDKQRPFPEEINRRIADVVADLCFAPTERARQNLLREGVPDGQIRLTGNTVIDTLLQVQALDYDWNSGPLAAIPRDKRLVLITAHRRESFGTPFEDLCFAIESLAARYDDCHFVYPVHLNPNVRKPVEAILSGHRNISLIEPLDYLPLVHLMKHSTLILTDSGGIQEEAPSLGVPVLVLREETERPEGVQAGAARLVGTNPSLIVAESTRLLDDADAHTRMSRVQNPYGDGRAAVRIVDALMETIAEPVTAGTGAPAAPAHHR